MNEFNNNKVNDGTFVCNMDVSEEDFRITTSFEEELKNVYAEHVYCQEMLDWDKENILKLTPDCDALDYGIAACSGVLCGVFDIFLVGLPDKSKTFDFLLSGARKK